MTLDLWGYQPEVKDGAVVIDQAELSKAVLAEARRRWGYRSVPLGRLLADIEALVIEARKRTEAFLEAGGGLPS